nr:MAG TPA: hypothetical protein [Caudoviricetes sp.]
MEINLKTAQKSVDISPVEWYYNIRKRKYKQGGFNYEIR